MKTQKKIELIYGQLCNAKWSLEQALKGKPLKARRQQDLINAHANVCQGIAIILGRV